MKNKILALGLSFTFLFAISPNTYASESANPKQEVNQENQNEEHSYVFNVTNISENQVTLSYAGEIRNDAREITMDDNYNNLVLSQDLFAEDVSLKDEYQIKTTKNIHELNKDNVKKEDLELIQKYEKPVNMPVDQLPENTDTIEVEVGEVFANDPINKAANVFEVGNKDNLYSISFDDLRDENPKVGDKYKIYWDGIIMESYPGQFGEIYRVEKLESKPVENWDTREFELVEIRDTKDSKEAILKDLKFNKKTYWTYLDKLKDENAQVGDRYLITFNDKGDDDMTQIQKVEKWMKKEDPKSEINYDELNKVIDEASKIVLGDQTYTKESAEHFQNTFTDAKNLLKKPDASQEEVDEAAKKVRNAIDGLTEEKEQAAPTKPEDKSKSNKSDENTKNKKENTKAAGVEEPKEDKKSVFGNPSTGITSIAPIAVTAILAGVGYAASKKNK
ncbi:FIVAR domain-containing protein [Anaerococcus sp. mt242]|uniref:FIVAR domain-containing protein n=2 Tax=Anaerococcus TaxID=165779 RepID=UPI001932EA69|nr:FIVAR domain-containing protein [Anaerococcus sp. mt242]MBM0046989.1 FIVAR domain-containing protein [Anaerococcus sp. mt242]